MDREKYYEQILNAVDTGILVVDSHDNILQHNQAALRLLDTDVLTHMNQVKGKLKDEHLAKHETQAMLKDKHVRIIALSDVSHELSNQEVDSWIKLIRVLTHEIMNTITPVTSLSETLLTRVTEDKDSEARLGNHPQNRNRTVGFRQQLSPLHPCSPASACSLLCGTIPGKNGDALQPRSRDFGFSQGFAGLRR